MNSSMIMIRLRRHSLGSSRNRSVDNCYWIVISLHRKRSRTNVPSRNFRAPKNAKRLLRRLNSELSGEKRYLPFGQPRPGR